MAWKVPDRTLVDDIDVTSSDLIIEFKGKIERGEDLAMVFDWLEI